MNEHVPALLPAEAQPAEVRAPLLAEESPPSSLPPAHSPEEIRAVDRAFVVDKEQNDAIAGFIGLWLSAPWLTGLIADHFRTPEEEEEPDLHRTLEGPEPHGHC